MHQPHADRNVSPISLSLTNGDPAQIFDRARVGGRSKIRAAPATLLPVYTPVRQRSLCFSHTASSINMPHCYFALPKGPKGSVALLNSTAHDTILQRRESLPHASSRARQELRHTKHTSAHTRTHTRQPTSTRTLSDPSFRPSGSLRFDPPQTYPVGCNQQ